MDVYEKCQNEPITIRDRIYSESAIDTFYFTNEFGCDSLYVILIEELLNIPDELQIQGELTLDINEAFDLEVPLDEGYSIDWEPAAGVSCSNCATTTLLTDGSIDVLTYTITDSNFCSRTFTINLYYTCPVYIPNVISLRESGSINASFGVHSHISCDLSDEYEMYIYDRC